jgi:glycine oxidase
VTNVEFNQAPDYHTENEEDDMMSTGQLSPSIVVVGGGIIGSSLAWELQRRGLQTVLLEQGQIGREASWATAGIIGAPTAAGLPPHRAALAERSQKRYAAFLSEVENDSGMSASYLHIGKVLVAFTEADVELAQAQVNWQVNHGFESTWLEASEVREIEPVIPNGILGAYFTRDGGALTGHRLTETVAGAFRARGGVIREHTPAVQILVDGDRVTGVDTPDGPIHAETVVLAAGAWTRFLGPGIQRQFPLNPVKGQMISVVPQPGARRPRHVVGDINGGYLVPRIDGTIAVGATREDQGFDKRVTSHAFNLGLDLMRRLGPSLLDASFTTAWAGLRAGTTDESPIMGPVSGYRGLWISTGHYRTGIQLAPGSAELMADAIATGKADDLLSNFSLDRFE